MSSAVVILSGGLDSSVNLAMALETMTVKLALTFDYGQRAAKKEISASSQLCEYYKVKHQVIEIPWVGAFGRSALTDSAITIPTGDVSIDDFKISTRTAAKVWVPNRNGIFLNLAAGFAEALDCKFVIPGFNLEEAATFPDNSEAFIGALKNSFSFSTANHVEVRCFTIQMIKTEILKIAVKKCLPLKMIWPCYFDGDKWCGECESCQRSKRAFKANGVDTVAYFKKFN